MVVPHPRIDTYALLTRPPLTELPLPVRLACVKHAASVRSEPGSNSQVHLNPRSTQIQDNLKLQRTDPNSLVASASQPKQNYRSVFCHVCKKIHHSYPQTANQQVQAHKPTQTCQPNHPIHHSLPRTAQRAPPTYPFLAYAHVKERPAKNPMCLHRALREARRLEAVAADVNAHFQLRGGAPSPKRFRSEGPVRRGEAAT